MFGFGKKRDREAFPDEARFFDRQFYWETYPDIQDSGLDPFVHFMTFGWLEGRNPSADFVTLYYRDKYLGGAFVNPLTDFAKHRSRLTPRPSDEEEYIRVQSVLVEPHFNQARYPDQIGAAPGGALDHYLRHGWKQLYEASEVVPISEYLQENRYVTALGVSPLYHFASQARFFRNASEAAERRENDLALSSEGAKAVIARHFDARYYLAHNRDVANAGFEPVDHYIQHGWREGRHPNPLFDSAFYLNHNSRLRRSGLNPYLHYLEIGRAKGRRPNEAGTRLYYELRVLSEEDWKDIRPAADVATAECIVLLPVYKGFRETLAAIRAVLSWPQTVSFALHVINDCSPDERLTEYLEKLASRKLFSYERNAHNLGFVTTINRGLERFPDRDVVLLNADAKVSGNWLDRLAAHAKRYPDAATITPLSNNATICSYPVVNANNVIELEHDAAGLDALAARCNAGRVRDIPTGVGFCFFMSARARAVLGNLDVEAFGKGYGEENDYCLRASKAGFRNLLAEDIFVYHVGQVSFGDPETDAPGQKALVLKHPAYPDLIRQYLTTDASETGRFRLDLMRIAATAGVSPVVFVYHSLSGGIITHIRNE
ncbi:MAG TPA: glycosyltransferase, partial [Chthoniobacterales bacterium]